MRTEELTCPNGEYSSYTRRWYGRKQDGCLECSFVNEGDLHLWHADIIGIKVDTLNKIGYARVKVRSGNIVGFSAHVTNAKDLIETIASWKDHADVFSWQIWDRHKEVRDELVRLTPIAEFENREIRSEIGTVLRPHNEKILRAAMGKTESQLRGTKENPGPLYGITGPAHQALALAIHVWCVEGRGTSYRHMSQAVAAQFRKAKADGGKQWKT